MMEHKDKFKEKADQADAIYRDCIDKLKVIRKKQNNVIGNLFKKTDVRKIDRIKKEIETI